MSRREQVLEGLDHFAGGSDVGAYLSRLGPTGEEADRVVYVPLAQITGAHWQPRVFSSPEEMTALAESIRRNGLLHPITVRPYAHRAASGDDREQLETGAQYEVVAGHQRLNALSMLAEESGDLSTATVPVLIRELDDVAARLLTHTENRDRADLGAWEEARSYLGVQEALRATGQAADLLSLAQRMGSRSKGTASEYVSIASVITPDFLRECFDGPIDWALVSRLQKGQLLRVVAATEAERTSVFRALIAEVSAKAPAVQHRTTRRQHATARVEDTEELMRQARFTYDGLRRHGGFAVKLSKPFSSYSPAQARAYLQDLLPAVAALGDVAAGDQPYLLDRTEGGGLVLYISPEAGRSREGRMKLRHLGRQLDALCRDETANSAVEADGSPDV